MEETNKQTVDAITVMYEMRGSAVTRSLYIGKEAAIVSGRPTKSTKDIALL
jgi:hypothetical protein